MYMPQTLRLVGALPPKERRGFVQGMTAVMEKWRTDNHDRGKTRWPALPFGKSAARRKGRK